jgi:hypothetical protein
MMRAAGTVPMASLEKANTEYEKYRKRTIDEPTPVERDFLENIKATQKRLESKDKNKGSEEPSP